jgi:hypothetical protein
MNEKRKALSLAAVLAATLLTGAAAVFGVTRGASPAPATSGQPVLVQPAAPSAPYEGGD